MLYFCCDKNRRNVVLGSSFNGIDFIEVVESAGLALADRQRFLNVYFLKPLVTPLSHENFSIEGGERIRPVNVIAVQNGAEPHILELEVDRAGDFSLYTLCLNLTGAHAVASDEFDPRMACIDFSFKVECASDFDCKEDTVCFQERPQTPSINYLAKDYASFRRLMLDRLSLVTPDWQQRSAADLGMTLVELLAYVGDHLSYQQDAVQTEGYFDLARHRISVKRHARLVDYHMHDGVSARVWMHLKVSETLTLDVASEDEAKHSVSPYGIQFFTAVDKAPNVLEPDSREYQKALKAKPQFFEPVPMRSDDKDEDDDEEKEILPITLHPEHNKIDFYTWSDEHCCLPVGATSATLKDPLGRIKDTLKPDAILIFKEVLDPETGHKQDADITHRHAVRLVAVTPDIDPITNVPVLHISWDSEDALTFALCISSPKSRDPVTGEPLPVSVAHGNIILCDHGRTVDQELDPVQDDHLYYSERGQTPCEATQQVQLPVSYKPDLLLNPVSQVWDYFPDRSSATGAVSADVTTTRPAIVLSDALDQAASWFPVRDLINSTQLDQHFVCEVNDGGHTKLRFGNERQGRRPDTTGTLWALYRIGCGRSGNVAADAIRHAATDKEGIEEVINFLPAKGGHDMESVESARRKAPYAYRRQERAVTEKDYAEVSERLSGIQKAQATFRWTGSWHTVFLTSDREFGDAVDDSFTQRLRTHVEKYRIAGYDLAVDAPRFVPLELELFVCVKPDYFRADVEQALRSLFSNQIQADGSLGLFHPDNFTFGQPVYLSPLYAAAQSVAGVDSVRVKRFKRLYSQNNDALETGRLELDRLEIAQLDNNPNYREHGVFHLELGGGK